MEEEALEINKYDTGLTYLYKVAYKNKVPMRYILVLPPEEGGLRETFSLDNPGSAKYITLFEFINKEMDRMLELYDDIKIRELWPKIKDIQSEGNVIELASITSVLFHSKPEIKEFVDQNEDAQKEFLEQMNEFMGEVGGPPYRNYASIVESYESDWLASFTDELDRDREELEKIIKFQNEISQIVPLDYTEIEIGKVGISYTYKNIDINPLPEHFNSSKTSYTVPFIQYNLDNTKKRISEQSQRYYKIYRGESHDKSPNYNNAIMVGDSANKPQTIYMNVWMGMKEDETKEAQEKARNDTQESFDVVSINYIRELKSLRVNLTSPYGKETIIKRVHRHLPLLELPKNTDLVSSRISGEFTILNCNLIEPIFFHVILTSPLFNNFIYLEEQRKLFTEKNKLNIHFRGANIINKVLKSSAIANIYPKMIPPRTALNILTENGTVKKVVTEKESEGVLVKIKRANTLAIAQQFQVILSRLFGKYEREREAILNLYFDIIPGYASFFKKEEEEKKNNMSDMQLARFAPDVFVSGYSRDVCQKTDKPTIINPDEVETWGAKHPFMNKRREWQDRTVLPFPSYEEPIFWFGCLHEDAPFPVVKENKILSNKDKYPFLPCCLKRDQLKSYNSDTYKYYHKSYISSTKSSHNYRLTANKIAEEGRSGIITASISAILSRAYPDDERNDFVRYGVYKSINSFLHCILYALGKEEGNHYLEVYDKEAYVSEFRKELLYSKNNPRGIRLELARQELYDKTHKEIRAMIDDETSFFDPLLFYRLLEEYFQVNIYIFNLLKAENLNKTSSLMIPRHRDFYVRPPRDRPVVLIVRHMGIVADALKYPHCELIIKNIPNRAPLKIFPKEMNRVLYPAFQFVARTLTWTIRDNNIHCHQNLYSSVNYSDLFGSVPVFNQYIDTNGKARMFVLKPIEGTAEEEETFIFVGVLPTAPLNAKALKDLRILYDFLPDYPSIIRVLGNPHSVYINQEEEIRGLWYAIGDIKYCLYAPCKKAPVETIVSYLNGEVEIIDILPETMVYIPEPSEITSISPLKRLRELNRAARFIQQIIKYLYLVHIETNKLSESQGEESLHDFFEKITVLYQGNEDSIDLYNMSKLPVILPRGHPEEILQALAKFIPKTFPGNPPRLLIYDLKMKNALLYQLKKFAKDARGLIGKPGIEGITSDLLIELQGYFEAKDDFNYDRRHEFLLSSRKEFIQWSSYYISSGDLNMRDIQRLKDSIQLRLQQNAFMYSEPYIYQRISNRGIGASYNPAADQFYIIQNVQDGSFDKCLEICIVWREKKRNLGYYSIASFTGDIIPAHVIYSISEGGGGTIVDEDNRFGSENYLEILRYNSRRYGAMLPIL